MDLTNAVSTKRGLLRTTGEALRFIERELPRELKTLPRWTFAQELLAEAHCSKKSRDLRCAYRQLRQALQNDLLLAD
jgi:hypothetical protein